MKAQFKLLANLTSASLLSLVTGCWTSDAHDVPTDAGPIGASQQCSAIAPNSCTLAAALPANGDFLDLSRALTFSLLNQWSCAQFLVVDPSFFGSSGVWVHNSTDIDAGNPYGVDWYPENPNDLANSPCHLGGTISGASSWGLYMNPAATCPDGSTADGVVDASAFDGFRITLKGSEPGPTGTTRIDLFSVGTPEDPYREQRLFVDVPIPPVTTTYKYLWSQMNAPCGRHEWFNPAKIINIQGEMVQLNGVAYPWDVEFGKIGFYKAN